MISVRSTPVSSHNVPQDSSVRSLVLILDDFCFQSQSNELSTWQRRVSEMTSRVAELEETLAKTQKELLKSQDSNVKMQHDLRENIAQKEDQVNKSIPRHEHIARCFLNFSF